MSSPMCFDNCIVMHPPSRSSTIPSPPKIPSHCSLQSHCSWQILTHSPHLWLCFFQNVTKWNHSICSLWGLEKQLPSMPLFYRIHLCVPSYIWWFHIDPLTAFISVEYWFHLAHFSCPVLFI